MKSYFRWLQIERYFGIIIDGSYGCAAEAVNAGNVGYILARSYYETFD